MIYADIEAYEKLCSEEKARHNPDVMRVCLTAQLFMCGTEAS